MSNTTAPRGELNKTLEGCAKMVESEILKILSWGIGSNFKDIINYQILTGGKRLRPALAIVCCRLFGGETKDILRTAAGLEILHNYTLILDDLIDNSVLRRNQLTLWAKFGRVIAQCIGANYSASIFQAINKTSNQVRVSEIFARALKTIFEGEIKDVLFEQHGRKKDPYIVENRYAKISEPDYLDMICKKTASLFEAACVVGGICAGAAQREINFLKNYGFNLGMAFQIQDDILDIFGGKEFGKKIGKDIEERKMGNIVILFALSELPSRDKKRFLTALKKRTLKNTDTAAAIELIKKTSARQKADAYKLKFSQKAVDNLKSLPKNKWSRLLEEAAEFVVEREK